jgi:threonine/homoserine/homoserine lactone efflux protein
VIAFLLVAVVVVVSPGPDFALTVRNTLARGRGAGVGTAAGVVTGQLVWEAATVAGLAALLIASRPAFLALRLIGAAYLIWLGVEALRAAYLGASLREQRAHGTKPFVQGLASNLGNPKMAVFFTSLLPQFGESAGSLVAHSALFSSLTLLWLAFVVRAGALLRVPSLRRALDAITGVVLVAFGLRLATERR